MPVVRSPYHSPKATLDQRGLRPRKRFGQNFLVDPRFADRVADAVPPDSYVIEIGGGTGALTAALAARARSVLVLEIDRDLAGVLRERFQGEPTRVEIVETDAAGFDFAGTLAAQTAPRAVCGNLPYNITTPLIERIVAVTDRWETAVLMVQREYARRLAAKPGTPDYGSLTVFVAYHCNVEKLFDVGAAGFYPAPSVASSVVRLTPRPQRAAHVHDEALLLHVIRAAFAQRRKTLANCLLARADPSTSKTAVEAAIRAAGIDERVRGERLDLDAFIRLANSLAASGIDVA
ncbi:MAG TPA: 16S rRNA (adenine(1518)-N(6)/adenine(1519)-N(6))-dimethyltransferase RsmA [Candidatus Eremiobacteraceae bacterium]|nr:16S rRNA (adenine(1518)-N(6)/adenine(1519)-N(6))-dimethyltransferase RsmA [Candidatus Eremiobacteraceae bacterium]